MSIKSSETQGIRVTKSTAKFRNFLLVLALMGLTSCATQQAGNGGSTTPMVSESERLAEQQAAAQRSREVARAETAKMEADRQARLASETAERERLERQRRAEATRAEQAAMRQQRETEARQQQAAIARQAAEKQAKLDRIAQLEQQISDIEGQNSSNAAANARLTEAIAVAENLLEVLNEEQAKYRNTDAAGNTVEALAKDLIVELENRKDQLVQDARMLSNQN